MIRTDTRLFPILFAALAVLALAIGLLTVPGWRAHAQEGSAPDKPKGLDATASHGQVILSWNDPGDDSITGYVILRRVRVNDQGGDFSVLVANTESAATTYTDNTVAASTTYTYRIKAINEHGTSERSRWSHVDTPAPPVPDKPTGLEATASHGQVVLTWNAPNDESITGYVILRRVRVNDTGGDFSVLVANTGSAATTYTDDEVAASTTYTYRIKAINGHGTSERSRWVHVDTPAAPEPAGNNPATGAPAIAGTAQVGETLRVDTSGIADEDGLGNATFSYQWLADGTAISGATANAYTPVEADEGKAITVQVNFTDDAGNDETLTSASTAMVAAAEPTEPPAKPADLSATASHDQVVLTWKDPDDDSITGYVILRRIRVNDQGGDFTELVADTGSAAATYTDNNVAASTTYTYRIKAINAAGTSERSRWVHVDTSADPAAEPPATPPEAPKLPTNATTYHVEGSRNWVTFRWERPEGDVDGYRVLRIRHSRMESRHRVVKIIDDPDVTEFEDHDVVEGSDFGWAVQAYNGAGSSDKSEHECGRLDSVYTEGSLGLAYPGDAQATFVEDDGNPGVRLEWSEPTRGYHGGEVSPATGYQILRWDINHGFPDWDLLVENTGSTDTSFIDRSILPNSQYSYQVRAWNDWGVGERSFQANVRTTDWDVPGAPKSLTVTHVDGGIQLQWNRPNDTDGEDTLYRIYRRENSGGVEPLQLLEAGYGDLQYVDNNVVDSVHYHYQVRVDGGDDVTAHGMLSRLVASGWD